MVMSIEEKKERKRIAAKKYYEKNKEKVSHRKQKYRQENKEKINLKHKQYKAKNKEKVALQNKEYSKTPNGKKVNTLGCWKSRGLIASKEEKDRIYNLYLNQDFCNACDVKLTRNSDHSKTDAQMDHCHETGRFRHVICHSCNCRDNWKKYFC
tara:strand:- start:25 stop:483 length:459 start_codon:yes stop_codon:yes gene_type:complete